jgi:mono/diheme cytochrome c family protein
MSSLIVRTWLSLGLLAVMASIAARSTPAIPSAKTLNDQEQRGKHLFLQRCSLCHLGGYSKAVDWTEADMTPRPIGPRLAGLLKNANPDKEKAIRTFILSGSAKMPGFQYALQPKQVDDLIAYMKTLP